MSSHINDCNVRGITGILWPKMLSIQGLVQIVKAPSTYVDLFIQKEGEQRKSYLTYVFYRMVPTNCTDVKRAKGIYFLHFFVGNTFVLQSIPYGLSCSLSYLAKVMKFSIFSTKYTQKNARALGKYQALSTIHKSWLLWANYGNLCNLTR